MTTTQAPEKLLLSPSEAADALGIGTSLLYEMFADGRFAPAVLKCGRKSLIRYRELLDWTDSGLPPRSGWTWPPKSGGKL